MTVNKNNRRMMRLHREHMRFIKHSAKSGITIKSVAKSGTTTGDNTVTVIYSNTVNKDTAINYIILITILLLMLILKIRIYLKDRV